MQIIQGLINRDAQLNKLKHVTVWDLGMIVSITGEYYSLYVGQIKILERSWQAWPNFISNIYGPTLLLLLLLLFPAMSLHVWVSKLTSQT
jgi:hypothetical protein